jgi:hypothetical protein
VGFGHSKPVVLLSLATSSLALATPASSALELDVPAALVDALELDDFDDPQPAARIPTATSATPVAIHLVLAVMRFTIHLDQVLACFPAFITTHATRAGIRIKSSV